jgi:hypothetical protein
MMGMMMMMMATGAGLMSAGGALKRTTHVLVGLAWRRPALRALALKPGGFVRSVGQNAALPSV